MPGGPIPAGFHPAMRPRDHALCTRTAVRFNRPPALTAGHSPINLLFVKKHTILIALSLFGVVSAYASDLTVFNTGVDNTGALLAGGTQDPNFLLFPSTCCGNGLNINVFNSTFLSDGAYSGAAALANTTTAQWIGYTGFGPYWANGSNATAAFTESFTLTAAEAASPQLTLSGKLGFTGDFVNINVNGVTDTADSFATDFGAALHSFTLTSGFQAGTNTVSFVQAWSQADGTAHGNASTGVIVDQLRFSGVTPEPGSFTLVGLAAAIGLLGRRKLSAAGLLRGVRGR